MNETDTFSFHDREMKMNALTFIGHGIKDYAKKIMRKFDLLNALHEDMKISPIY